MGQLATLKFSLSVFDGQRSQQLADETILFAPGTLLPQIDRYTISATTEQTLTVPTGAKQCVILPEQAEGLLLRASSGGATVVALTPTSSPTGAPVAIPIDASVTASLFIYNGDSAAATVTVVWC